MAKRYYMRVMNEDERIGRPIYSFVGMMDVIQNKTNVEGEYLQIPIVKEGLDYAVDDMDWKRKDLLLVKIEEHEGIPTNEIVIQF